MIDWQRLTLNLRQHYKPLTRVAREVGCDEATLQRLARADVLEPRFSLGIRLLDLHADKCQAEHRRDVLMVPEQIRIRSNG